MERESQEDRQTNRQTEKDKQTDRERRGGGVKLALDMTTLCMVVSD